MPKVPSIPGFTSKQETGGQTSRRPCRQSGPRVRRVRVSQSLAALAQSGAAPNTTCTRWHGSRPAGRVYEYDKYCRCVPNGVPAWAVPCRAGALGVSTGPNARCTPDDAFEHATTITQEGANAPRPSGPPAHVHDSIFTPFCAPDLSTINLIQKGRGVICK